MAGHETFGAWSCCLLLLSTHKNLRIMTPSLRAYKPTSIYNGHRPFDYTRHLALAFTLFILYFIFVSTGVAYLFRMHSSSPAGRRRLEIPPSFAIFSLLRLFFFYFFFRRDINTIHHSHLDLLLIDVRTFPRTHIYTQLGWGGDEADSKLQIYHNILMACVNRGYFYNRLVKAGVSD